MGIISTFVKRFIVKYLTSVALEKIVIIGLGELVERTDSKVDDKVYKAIFEKTQVSQVQGDE